MIYVMEIHYRSGAWCKKKFRISHEVAEELAHYRQCNFDKSYNEVDKIIITFELE